MKSLLEYLDDNTEFIESNTVDYNSEFIIFQIPKEQKIIMMSKGRDIYNACLDEPDVSICSKLMNYLDSSYDNFYNDRLYVVEFKEHYEEYILYALSDYDKHSYKRLIQQYEKKNVLTHIKCFNTKPKVGDMKKYMDELQ